MVRSKSEAICETTGSMMNQQSGKNQHLNPNNFNVEMFLRFNLGPLHKLDGLVAEIFAFNSKKSYVREEKIISLLPSGDPAKSNAISTFEKKDETKSRLPESFWDSSSSK